MATSSQIVQFACVSENIKFNRYVLPTCAISASATTVTGLCIVNGQLFCHKEKVHTVGIVTCPKDCKAWLQTSGKPILVCHNGKVFDFMILVKTLMNNPVCGALPIEGLVDSLHVFEELSPNRNSYKLESLMLNTLSMSNNAYSAVEDVKTWQSLHNFSSEVET